jgi:ABC-type transport system involved in multi-copper enzyme maturation permease subunit
MQLALARQPSRPRSFPIVALFGKEITAKLWSPWPFLLASGACLIAVVYGSGFQSGFETETVLVTANPLAVLNAIVSIFLAVLLGMRLAAGVAWEREHGTLEVLLMSPAGPRAIVLAKFAAEFVVLLVLLGIYAAFMLVAQPLGSGVIRPDDVLALATNVALVLPVMAMGLLVSCFFGSVRAAVIAYLVALAVLSALQALLLMLQQAQPQDLSLAMLFVRAGLEQAAPVLGLVSPAAPLADLGLAAVGSIVIGPSKIAAALVLALVAVVLGGEITRARGAA